MGRVQVTGAIIVVKDRAAVTFVRWQGKFVIRSFMS